MTTIETLERDLREAKERVRRIEEQIQRMRTRARENTEEARFDPYEVVARAQEQQR